jgi:nucleotide-binding universal stress UspA family protein
MNTAPSRKAFNNFGMEVGRLLLPIDLRKCPPEAFTLANGFAKPFGGEVVLLSVLDAPMAEAASMRERAHLLLEHLARDFLRSSVEARPRVRSGLPHEEIFAEAAASKADMILLPVFAPSIWRRLVGPRFGSTARHVVSGAPCGVFVIDVQARFNCLRRWSAQASPRQCAA